MHTHPENFISRLKLLWCPIIAKHITYHTPSILFMTRSIVFLHLCSIYIYWYLIIMQIFLQHIFEIVQHFFILNYFIKCHNYYLYLYLKRFFHEITSMRMHLWDVTKFFQKQKIKLGRIVSLSRKNMVIILHFLLIFIKLS